jgi:RHS repeat-associated protein
MVWGTDTGEVHFYRHYVSTPSVLTVVVSRNDDGSTTTTCVLSDHLGSSDALIDGRPTTFGNVLVQESFGAFGLRRASTWTGVPSSGDYLAISKATRRGFTFQGVFDNIGLVHMNGRVYDPKVGRFLTANPIGEVGATRQRQPAIGRIDHAGSFANALVPGGKFTHACLRLS